LAHFFVQRFICVKFATSIYQTFISKLKNLTLLGFIFAYMAVTVAVGWWAGRRVKSAADFAVAGKQLPMFMAACALFATWFGSETVMGASSRFVDEGVPGIIEDPFGAALCLVLAGLLVAKPLYKLNLLTFSDFFKLRFNKATELVSAFFMVPSYFSWIAAQLVALGILMQTVGGIDRHWGIAICTLMVLFYTYVGGMWSVAITDFVQTIVIVVGLLILATSVLMDVGGFQPLFASVPTEKTEFFNFFPKGNSISIMQWIAAWMTIGLGSIPQQDVFQRVMGAKTERASVQACYTSGFMYLTVALIPLVISWGGSVLYPDLAAGDKQELIPSMVLEHYGLPMQILFFGALMSAILSTASGAMLAPATVIGENLVKEFYKKEMDDQTLLRTMRMALVVVALVTGGMALWRNDIFDLVSESSALSLVSLFVPLIAGLYWKRANSIGAIASMVAGIVVWLGTLWFLPKVDEHAATPENPTFGEFVGHITPMLWGFMASILAMVLGSLLTKKEIHEDLLSKRV
jgi:solute:Na+ symporter, SSS family